MTEPNKIQQETYHSIPYMLLNLSFYAFRNKKHPMAIIFGNRTAYERKLRKLNDYVSCYSQLFEA